MAVNIAIDTGGTFTDLVLADEQTGRLYFHKIASTPDDPGKALVDGIEQITAKAGYNHHDIKILIHGTTVATNAILQRNGAKVAMITTAGFRDVLHIQRQDRPLMYDLRCRPAEPLVPRSLRLELNERMGYDGRARQPIDEGQLEQLIDELKQRQVDAVAVGLLHSYANPEHEQAVGQTLAKQLPDATVCLSHELVQEQGEYERFSTCAINAFVQPVMQRYLTGINRNLNNAGIKSPLFVMKSNGGTMSVEAAARQCVHTILSGPAGGVVAGKTIAQDKGRRNLITTDMGGTSFDVAVIHEGDIAFARDNEMAGLAIKVPMLDIHTVGAGGGSIGWIDSGQALRVGPQSAVALPGPPCYGRGGSEPTVTDANLILGRLSPTSLLGGDLQLDTEAAHRAVHDRLARPLGLSVEDAAEGMIQVVNSAMNAAIRKLTVERGFDPRVFTLCPFGGAGPLHGAELAHEMGVQQVLIPPAPGVTSAVGLLMSNLREDHVRTLVGRLDQINGDQITNTADELAEQAADRLAFARQGKDLRTTRQLGLRYLGQGFDIPVPIAPGTLELQTVSNDFHCLHQRMYGFARHDQPIELVNIWVSVEVDLASIELPRLSTSGHGPEPVATRNVIFDGQGHDTPVFQRNDLSAHDTLQGPAIIEQLDSTTVVWPGQDGQVDPWANLVLAPISDKSNRTGP